MLGSADELMKCVRGAEPRIGVKPDDQIVAGKIFGEMRPTHQRLVPRRSFFYPGEMTIPDSGHRFADDGRKLIELIGGKANIENAQIQRGRIRQGADGVKQSQEQIEISRV